MLQVMFFLVYSGQHCSLHQILGGAERSVRLRHSRCPSIGCLLDIVLAILHLQVWEEDRHVPFYVDNTAYSGHTSLWQLLQVGKLSSSNHCVHGLVSCLSHNLVSGGMCNW